MLPVPLKATNDSVHQYQSHYWPQKKSASSWSPAAHPADDHCSTKSCSTFPTNFAIHPSSSYLSELTGISPQCHCFHLFPIFALLQENWEKSSQVKQTGAAGVGSAHIQTSEASEAIRNFSCCKDAWHPRKSGPGLRWLGVSLPLEFSVVIPDVHLISISSCFHTCQSQGLAVSCVRRKLFCTFFSLRESSGEHWRKNSPQESFGQKRWCSKSKMQLNSKIRICDIFLLFCNSKSLDPLSSCWTNSTEGSSL